MPHVRLALRALFRSPFVTIIAILSLAIGIGANTAIFSLYDQMLLRPLPVHAPDELVNLGAPGPKSGSTSCNNQGSCEEIFSYPMFRDLQTQQQVFSGMAGHRSFGANLAYKGQTMNGSGMLVSGNYFPLLGLQPALGRLIGPEDDTTRGGHFIAVLSHAYWRTRFNADPNVLNQPVIVNGQSLTIVGVAPEGFTSTSLGSIPHVFVPLTMRGLMQPGFTGFDNRRAYWVYAFARLQPGVSIEQARAGINQPYRSILQDVEAPLQTGMSDQTLARFKEKTVTVEPGARGQSSIHRNAGTPLLLLLSVTGVVLLIACANIANLLLVRGAGRAGEMAVRLSIGANRWHLVRQLMTESLLLGLLGGLVSLLMARWTLDLMASLLPPEPAATIDFAFNPTVIAFAGALAVGTALVFGLFPALHSTRPGLVATLKEDAGQKGASRGASRVRVTLATAQIALSMTLLVAAGLFMRSLVNVSRVDLGIQTDNVLTFAVSPSLNGYTPERSRALFERMEDELAALPGVTSVTASLVPALSGSNWGTSVSVQGFDAGPDTDVHSNFNEVSPGYFRTLGIPLLAGRDFTRADALGTAKVAIVNEAFTRKFNLGGDAVGKRMASATGNAVKLDTEIIGVVKDAKYSEVKDRVPPLLFRPYRQDAELGFMTFYARTAMDPETVMPAIGGVVSRLDPNLPVEDLKTLTQQVRDNVFLDRMITTLSASFAVIATLLAAIGLYGVLAYTVAQRTREFGVRMALGADGGRVRGMVLRQVGWMTVIGGAIGLAGALGVGRMAQSLLFEIEGHDPGVLAGAAALLVVVALVAGFVPANRAARIDPMNALRYE